jgi:cell division protein FtsB
MRWAIGPAVVSALIVGFLLLAVFPTRTYLAQRAATSHAQERLDVLSAENEALEARVALLGSDGEIERLARGQYNLVRPGEDAYAVLPPPPTTVAPEAEAEAAAEEQETDERNLFRRAWDGILGLF